LLAELFRGGGACARCWCIYWRVGPQYRKAEATENARAFFEIVKEGQLPGLLALDNEVAVGWCQLTPRGSLPHLERKRKLAALDGRGVWSLSCFYVRKGRRKQGVTEALIRESQSLRRHLGGGADTREGNLRAMD
jgi:hypothetical protein